MNNLNLILEDMKWIYLIAFAISLSITMFFKNKRIIISVLALNWAPIVGLAVMLYLAMFSKSLYSSDLLLLVIMIEAFILIIITLTLRDLLIKIQEKITFYSSKKILIKFFIINNLILFYLIVTNPTSMGVFSEGSRIDYMAGGTLPLLLTYLSMVIQTAIMMAVGIRIYAQKLSKLDFFTILFAFIGSLLSGSKGAVFLSIAYMMVIAWGLGHHFNRKLKIILPLLATLLVGSYTYFLSRFLNTTFVDNVNLAISRFILSADGRALASDYQIHDALMRNTHGNLLSEIFKGFAPRLGSIVSDIPLGVAQYAAAFNINSYVGANAGISSTILSYYENPIDMLSIFICLMFTVFVVAVGYLAINLSNNSFEQFATIAFIVTSVLTLVQDYQAFVLTAFLLFVWVICVLTRRTIRSASRYASNYRCAPMTTHFDENNHVS